MLNVFGYNKETGVEKTQRLIKLLKELYDITFVGELPHQLVFQFPYDMKDNSLNYKWFTVSDNGGELNVNLINSDDITRSVAYSTSPSTSVETMAYRVSQAAYSKNVDYALKLDEVLEVRTEIMY